MKSFPRKVTSLSVVLGIVAATAIAAGVAYAATASTITTSDAVVRSSAKTMLPAQHSVAATVTKLTLPAGNWVVHADDSAVGLNQPTDVVRCSIALASGPLESHGTQIGNAPNTGPPASSNAPAYFPLIAQLSETAGIKVNKTTTVYNTCSHDNNTGGSYYIDPDAEMWAHKAASLTTISMP
jgi:hypothetical protein